MFVLLGTTSFHSITLISSFVNEYSLDRKEQDYVTFLAVNLWKYLFKFSHDDPYPLLLIREMKVVNWESLSYSIGLCYTTAKA